MRFIAMLPLMLCAALAVAQTGDVPWKSVVEKADTDHDGSVSMDEVKEFPYNREFLGFQAFMADHYIAFDHDGDGRLTAEELREGISRIGMTDEEVYHGFLHGFAFMSVQ